MVEPSLKATRPKSPIVTLVVGTQKEEVYVHKDMLCETSLYFERALNGSFKEAAALQIRWKDEEVAVVTNFAGWLYFRRLGDSHDEMTLDLSEIERLYFFAHRMDIKDLMDYCIDAWRDRFVEKWALPSKTAIAWTSTTDGTKFRALFVDVLAHVTGKQIWDRKGESYILDSVQADLLVDIIHRQCTLGFERPKNSKDWLQNLDLCPYHEHKPDGTCPIKARK